MTPIEGRGLVPGAVGLPHGFVRVRFRQNVSYGGVDYGPSYGRRIAIVREDWARSFVRTKKAEYYMEPATPDLPVESEQPVEVPAPATPELPTESVGDGQSIPTPLPFDFPGRAQLLAAGIATLEQLDRVHDFTEIRGIGAAKAAAIREARG